MRYRDARSGEHMGVSPLTWKTVKSTNKVLFVIIYFIAIIYLSFDNFSILGHENKNFLLEIKESFIIMTDKPSLNRNTSSTPLYLFDKVS